ncbi:hypothetical protein NDU88_003841 [Pleurodeles waltl]|uniref:Uncharacterized protein n=1 Tax=Pleurodeles waltl TaxID=8319 RepID=A0AAV7SH34_PLEWA|nr:hypothetical protein NDU88_003841 [Pleurodeles waltl]
MGALGAAAKDGREQAGLRRGLPVIGALQRLWALRAPRQHIGAVGGGAPAPQRREEMCGAAVWGPWRARPGLAGAAIAELPRPSQDRGPGF